MALADIFIYTSSAVLYTNMVFISSTGEKKLP